MSVERTSEALDLSEWRVRDVLQRHDAGDSTLAATGVHRRRLRASTELTPKARLLLRKTILASSRMYADELAYALWATLGTGGDEPVCISAINTAL